MMEFVTKYYIWIITIGLFLIFALIGFLVDNVKHKKEKESEILNQQGELTEDERKMLENVDSLTADSQTEVLESVNPNIQAQQQTKTIDAPDQSEQVETINENGNN